MLSKFICKKSYIGMQITFLKGTEYKKALAGRARVVLVINLHHQIIHYTHHMPLILDRI